MTEPNHYEDEDEDQDDGDEQDEDQEDGPKFGRLLLVLVVVVLLCGVLTWLMATVFPDFPNFS